MKIPPQANRLTRSFYDRPTVTVARELLGKALMCRTQDVWVGGLIVETEAYLPAGDPASHSARGKTPSNASMFGPPGTLYVYPIHAKYCMNAVTGEEGVGSAVLIRAIEPIWGIDVMKKNRGYEDRRRLTRGPAMLCQALDIDRGNDGVDLVHARAIFIGEISDPAPIRICSSRRIGLSRAVEHPYRFFIYQNKYVSGRASDHNR